MVDYEEDFTSGLSSSCTAKDLSCWDRQSLKLQYHCAQPGLTPFEICLQPILRMPNETKMGNNQGIAPVIRDSGQVLVRATRVSWCFLLPLLLSADFSLARVNTTFPLGRYGNTTWSGCHSPVSVIFILPPSHFISVIKFDRASIGFNQLLLG